MRIGYTSKPSTAWLGSQVPSVAELQGPEYYLWVTYNLFLFAVVCYCRSGTQFPG